MANFDPKYFNKVLEAMRKGKKKDMAIFYNTYHPAMVTFAYEILGNVYDAEDIASERFCYFINKPEQKYVDFPYSWLKTATQNAAIQLIMRKRREDMVDFSDELTLEKYHRSIEYNESYQQVEFESDFYKILNSLEDDLEKEILTLRIKNGMTSNEIAKAMNVKIGVVKYRLIKIKQILKNFYN